MTCQIFSATSTSNILTFNSHPAGISKFLTIASNIFSIHLQELSSENESLRRDLQEAQQLLNTYTTHVEVGRPLSVFAFSSSFLQPFLCILLLSNE